MADLIVLVSGRKGTEDIYYAARINGKLVLPVGKTGGVAKKKWEGFSQNLSRYYSERILLDDFRNLYPANYQYETIAKWTVNLAEQLHAPKAAEMTVGRKETSRQPRFQELIGDHFNMSELRVLCSDLKIRWENISGETRGVKVVEIIEYCSRHGKEKELVMYIQEKRPKLIDKIP